ncbi:hypothetical protein [Coraliomargarita akajimensis]|uniref:Uncharacterized protein n=1 Tax=Coraliomargarita akajimensis (strain DSM 45221 / IAM 15411 / JCM 23193 / KCTC 12865 / 04OKA010-24) TaxID=583355 RepID=D5ENT6_CORAD|nr:hypothetical protein [Coraliomargarita akajimensis]ADE53595.1 hypothetical protein Caka_0570 [Coraliomargarita akajimensis DSM 45221]
MKYLKREAEPELKGYHLQSMGYLALVFLAALCLAGLAWGFGDIVMPFVLPAFFTLPVFMFGIMIWRTTSVHCPDCNRKMHKTKRIEVIEDQSAFGRYPYSPWNVFECASCDKGWRVPAIAIGEGHSVSLAEYQKIKQDRAGNG